MRSIHRLAAAFVMGVMSTLSAAAQKTDAPKRNPHHEEGIEGPERIREAVHTLRAHVDRLQQEVHQAVAAGDTSNRKVLSTQAKVMKRHLDAIERRLEGGTPVLDRMRHHAEALEKELASAKANGDELAAERLEKEIAGVHDRIAKVETARESGGAGGPELGHEHPRPPSPEAMEERADAMLARAKKLDDSKDSERAAALRRAAVNIQERATKLRNGEPLGPRDGEHPRPHPLAGEGARPGLPAAEAQALRSDVEAIKKELRDVRSALRQLSKDRTETPARQHHHKAGSDGVKHAR